MIDPMQLTWTLAWLVDAAAASPDADRLLAELGAHLIEDGVKLAGGALTLAAPHPIIARRTWLWRGESGGGVEARRFAAAGGPAAGAGAPPPAAGRGPARGGRGRG